MTSDVSGSFAKAIRARYESFKKTFFFFTRSPIATAGLAIVLFYILVAIFGPMIVGGNPWKTQQLLQYNGIYIYNTPLPPSLHFPFGTTFEGYNLFNGVVKAARIDIGVAAIVVFSGAFIGTILGSIAGYKGGVVGDVIMRVTDIFLSIPFLVLAIAFLVILGRNLTIMVVALMIIWWPTYTRIVRGQVLSVRELKYVEASVAAGASSIRTIVKHVIPNSIYPIFVQISLDFGNVILTLASLFYLGVGFAGYYTPEWGNLIGLAATLGGGLPALTRYWWTITIPGLAILILVISLNLLGDGLRDVMDPRLRR
ncbi:MAG: ABC transporter permease [Thermoplasmatales archaeon]